MKPVLLVILTCLLATFNIGCVSNSTPGSASARINDGRNRRGALVSDSDYAQQNRQRRNESEEYALRRQERQDQYESVTTPFRTARDTLGYLGVRLGGY